MHLPANTEFGCQNLPESALIKDEGYSAKSTYYLVLNSRLHEGHDAGYRRARRNVQLVAGGAPDHASECASWRVSNVANNPGIDAHTTPDERMRAIPAGRNRRASARQSIERCD
jgi:hypothetical protein